MRKTVRVRWGAIFQPWCWVVGHRAVDVEGGTWADPSGARCVRCGAFDVFYKAREGGSRLWQR